MATEAKSWFEVDKAGLAAILEDRGKASAVLELIQNGWDADGVTRVEIDLTPEPERARWRLVVEDDSPDGFHDLTHSYVMFAPSEKKANAEKRGRFNLGEKLVLAICEWASVLSTTGGVQFNADGSRRAVAGRRDAGSRFEGVLRMTKVEAEEALAKVRTLIPPVGVTTVLNGEKLAERQPLRVLPVRDLATVVADEEGNLRKSGRNTTLSLHEPLPGEVPSIYEMGIPVVESGDRFHVDVAQKVPLNFDRDNVTPAYLRRIRTEVLNGTVDLVTREDVTSTWVKEALEDDRVAPEVVRDVMIKRFGEKAVAYDPTDPEANKIAMGQGYTVVHGGTLSKDAWANVRGVEGLLPRAGAVTPSPAVLFSSDGKPAVDPVDYSDGMRAVVAYSKALAEELLGKSIEVQIFKAAFGESWGGAYRPGQLSFNLTTLGRRFFDEPRQEAVDALLLHEFAHDAERDHFSSRFIDAACALGARMRGVTIRVADFADEPVR